MNRINSVAALVFLVLLLALIAVRAWMWGPSMWSTLDGGIVVFTAVSAWLAFAFAIYDDGAEEPRQHNYSS